MKYFEITKESKAYEMCVRVWNCNKTWKKAIPDLMELLPNMKPENIVCNAERLTLEKVPDNLKGEFLKNPSRNGYEAKINSETNKKFLKISNKHDLYYSGVGDIAFILGTAWHNGHESYYPPMNESYYFETERKIERPEGLVEISEPDFLRIRADWLENNK